MNKGLALVLGSALLAAAAWSPTPEDADSQEQNATPIDRLLLGQASAYPADLAMGQRSPVLDSSMVERRKMAWGVIEKVITPVTIGGKTTAQTTDDVATSQKLPRFQTWHAREEVLPMFDRLFRGLSEEDRAARAPFPAQAIADVFPWNATRATSLASFTQERLDQRRAELQTPEGLASLGKDQRVLMSPDYVTHLFESYNRMLDCKASDPVAPGTTTEPASSAAFAPCLNGEFPAAAVAVKTRWMPSTSAVPVYDTSAAGVKTRLENGTFPDQGDGQLATPDPSQVYTMQLTADTTSRLVAMHIITKELRDWVWITMWWSPTPNEDFGADRPASITGAFANYKMCVVTAYDEKDKAPGTGLPKSLADAVNAANDGGGSPGTWCSNPYLETAEHSAKTNCIGCHQNGGTQETTDTILAQDAKFPDHARTKVRNDFPADYAFTTTGGLEIASEFKNRIEAVSPTPATP
jgi:hypothetical protein